MKRIQLQQLRLATGFVALSLAACSATGTHPDNANQANVGASILTFSVGTANLYGTATGLNVYAAFRQPAGALSPGSSAALVSEPTLSGPFGALPAVGAPSSLDSHSTVQTGPAAGETTSFGYTAQAQTPVGVSSFGTSGGVFGLGIEPFNFNSISGTPATYTPYKVPLFDPATDNNGFVPWGGAPAFDPDGKGQGVHDGQTYPDGVQGVSEGLDVFYGVTPVAGSAYSLSVTVPATSTAPTTISGTSTITTVTHLPLVPVPAPVYDGTGGVSFTTTFPAGVTEEYVQVVDSGPATGTSCNGSSSTSPIYYTLVVTPSTVQPAKIAAANGPSTSTGGAICTGTANGGVGDTYTVQIIGFDYDAYAASYPSSAKNPSPVVPSQVDLSVTAPVTYTSP